MARPRKPLAEENVEATPLDTDEQKLATVLPEVAPPAVVVHGEVTASGVRQIVPHVATGNDPHVHTWVRGRRADNSQTYRCGCGLERDR